MRERSKRRKKIIIGLTGGVGAGKSMVTGLLKKQYGALILEADSICRKLMEPAGPAYDAVLDCLGSGILRSDGTIDTAAMARIIFQDSEKRSRINGILHPATFEAVRKRMSNSRKKLIVYESALPREARFSELCDYVLLVSASEEIRRKRLAASRGYSDEKISAIMESQLSEQAFRQLSDAVLVNESDEAQCAAELKRILTDWGITAVL
ncbi:MAG: dephospho-CoA kinase [Lachnospiraceae bacterium]|nr:dephospho-CoA kinase [Lachnospiraceae bacterium]